jgi:chitinase
MLTAAVGIGRDKIYTINDAVPAYDPAHLSHYVDYINLMAYDIHGHWDDKTGHHALAHPKLEDDSLGRA